MLVKTYLDKTSRGDLGVFASEKILKGTIVWQYDPSFDKILDEIFVEKLPAVQKKFVKKYAYLTKTTNDTFWILCVDDNRFLNHSEEPNLEDTFNNTIASKDIEAGEELTCNYYTFDLHAENKLKNEY